MSDAGRGGAVRRMAAGRVTLDDGQRARGGTRWCWRIGNQPPEPLAVGDRQVDRFHQLIRGSEAARRAIRQAAAERRRRPADRHRADDGRHGAVARRGGASRADRRVSRRGQMPRGACRCAPAPVDASDAAAWAMLVALWRWLRRRSGEVGWRAAVDCAAAAQPGAVAVARASRAAALPAPCAAVVGRPPPPHRARGRARRSAAVIGGGPAGDRSPGGSRAMREDDDGLQVEIARRGAEASSDRAAASRSPSIAPGRSARSSGPAIRCFAQLLDDGLVATDPLGHRARGR